MGKFFEKKVVELVLVFILRQLQKFRTQLDWTILKVDWEPRIRKAIPGEWLDQTGVDLAKALVDGARTALANTVAIQNILADIANGDWENAYTDLKALILAAVGGDQTPLGLKLTAALS